MAGKKKRVHVTTPGDLTDLLWLAAERPDAYLMAGGTDLMRRQMPDGFPERIIDLTAVSDLARLSRTERWLDLGAALPLARLLGMARNVLPRVLLTAVGGIGSPALRSQATIGGNVCLASPLSDTIAPLFALDARLELRSSGGLRWLPVSLFLAAQGSPALRPGEVVCRVRIPLAEWDFGAFRKVSPKAPPSQSILGFCGLARLQRDVLGDVRFAVTGLYRAERGAPAGLPRQGRRGGPVGAAPAPLAPADRAALRAVLRDAGPQARGAAARQLPGRHGGAALRLVLRPAQPPPPRHACRPAVHPVGRLQKSPPVGIVERGRGDGERLRSSAHALGLLAAGRRRVGKEPGGPGPRPSA